jgi:predicted AAA+ superfamily ATPase
MNNEGLILFANVSDDAAATDAAAFHAPGGTNRAAWVSLQRAMLADVGTETVEATYWRNHICALVGSSDNPFSRAAEKGVYADLEEMTREEDILRAAGQPSGIEPGMLTLAASELARVKEMYAWEFPLAEGGTQAQGNIAALEAAPRGAARRQRVHDALTADADIVSAVMLAGYYRSRGAGAFEASDSYSWDGAFAGVDAADDARLDNLIGLERQTDALRENMEFLLRGLPARNMLLYGDSGSGKSSSVRALAAEYADRGVKLVAVPKSRISELPEVMDAVRNRGLKFIVYIDDLSFEDGESAYKSFKSTIEGGVRERPDNVVICVTSNRRGIVKEVWEDREGRSDVHRRDNIQEKRSLAERFGLTLVYSSPDKDEYLAIVAGLARIAGLDADPDELMAAALTWAVRHGGRSGRTARQFVDFRVSSERLT